MSLRKQRAESEQRRVLDIVREIERVESEQRRVESEQRRVLEARTSREQWIE